MVQYWKKASLIIYSQNIFDLTLRSIIHSSRETFNLRETFDHKSGIGPFPSRNSNISFLL